VHDRSSYLILPTDYSNEPKVIETEKENIALEKLTKIQGIGNAKAGQILSAFELAKCYLIKAPRVSKWVN